MVWPVIAAVAGSTATRYVIGGVVTYVIGTEIIGSFSEGADDRIKDFEDGLKEDGINVLAGFGEGLLQVAEYGGVAIQKGVGLTYNELRKSLLENTADTFTALTIGAIVTFGAIKLYSMAKGVVI